MQSHGIVSRMRLWRWMFLLAVLAAVVPAVAGDDHGSRSRRGKGPRIENVIVMVPDGCDTALQTLARWYLRDQGKTLTLDRMLVGAVETYMIDSVIPDSAAQATQFATGFKTADGFVGMGPGGESVLSTVDDPPEWLRYRPLATVLEAAKLKGMATGLVATSRITHATPASYGAHVQNRGSENEIMEHLVYNDIDVVFGGGKRHLLPKSAGGSRTDGENLLDVLKARGVTWVGDPSEMQAAKKMPVWGLFANSHLAPDLDRDSKAEPSLAEMTRKAIDLLSANQGGFFLFVEASQVDWAGHANDPIYMTTDFLAFDEAVKVAVDFARRDGKTAVVCWPDHDTGALSIGSGTTGIPYTATSVEDLLDPLKGMKCTSEKLAGAIGSGADTTKVMDEVKKWWGLAITRDDAQDILDRAKAIGLSYALAEILSARYTVLGWTTHGHLGDDVPLWAYGADGFSGLMDSTELATATADLVGYGLSAANARLYVDLDSVSSSWKTDDSDPANLVVVVGNARLPDGKDLLILGSKTWELEGLVVYVPKTGKWFIPREAVKLLAKYAWKDC